MTPSKRVAASTSAVRASARRMANKHRASLANLDRIAQARDPDTFDQAMAPFRAPAGHFDDPPRGVELRLPTTFRNFTGVRVPGLPWEADDEEVARAALAYLRDHPPTLQVGDVVQIAETVPPLAGSLMVVTVIGPQHVQGEVRVPGWPRKAPEIRTVRAPWAHVRFVGRPPFPFARRPEAD